MTTNRDRSAEKLLAQNPGEPTKPAMKTNADEILHRFMYTFAPDTTVKPDNYTTIDLPNAKQQLADGLVAALPRLNEKDYFDDSSPEWYQGYEAHLKATESAIYAYFGIGRNQ